MAYLSQERIPEGESTLRYDKDDVGVVAIGRNEGERLTVCLASIKSETNNIVYVDSGSADGSVAAAERIGAFVVNLDSTRPFTAARAYNEGFKALKALKPGISFVEFVDGDCTLARGWLYTAIAFIDQRKDVAVVSGRLRERHPTASVYNRLLDIEWDTPIGEVLECGANALVRVEAFEAVGGFNPKLIAGEEPELCLRLRKKGWKIWRLDAEVGLHDAAMTRFSQWWVRSVRSGYAMADVSHRRKIASTMFGGVPSDCDLPRCTYPPGCAACRRARLLASNLPDCFSPETRLFPFVDLGGIHYAR